MSFDYIDDHYSDFSQSEEFGGDARQPRLPVVPLIASFISVALSLAIYFLQYQLASTVWFFVGYCLTPLATTLCLGWNFIATRSALHSNLSEERKSRSRLRALNVLAFLGFVLAIPHIYNISSYVGTWLVQSGISR